MEGSTVTDSSLLPVTMPVTMPGSVPAVQAPSAPSAPSAPTAVADAGTSEQTVTFADLFSRMLSTEASMASGELPLAEPSVETVTLESVLPTEQPVLSTSLEPLLNATVNVESASVPSLLTSEAMNGSVASDLPEAVLTDPASMLPAIISKVLSEQGVPGKELASAVQTLQAGTPADNAMGEGALALSVARPSKLIAQDSQPDTEPAKTVTNPLRSLSETPGITPSVPVLESATKPPMVELASVPDIQLQARPAEVDSQPMASSVSERSALITEAPSTSMVEKPAAARTVLDPATFGQLGDRIMVMINKELQQAQIRMDPPGLGHLKIALSIEGDQVSVQFAASQSGLKELIIQQTDRLRQQLEEQQLNLVSVDVTTDQGCHSRDSADERAQTASASLFSADVSRDEGMLPVAMPQYSAGLLDVYV